MNENTQKKKKHLNELNVASLALTKMIVIVEYTNFTENGNFYQLGCDTKGNFIINKNSEIIFTSKNAFLTLSKYKEILE